MKPFRNWKIRTQVIAMMLALALVLSATLSVIMMGIARRNIEDNYIKTIRDNLQALTRVMDLRLKTTVNLVREFLATDEVLTLLDRTNGEDTRYFSAQETKLLIDEWSPLEKEDAYLDGCFLFDDAGHFFKRLIISGSAASYLRYYTDSWKDEPWADQVQVARGKEVFFGGDLLEPSGNRNVITFAKMILKKNTFEPLGMLAVTVRTSVLSDSLFFSNNGFPSDTLMLLDGKDCLYISGGKDAAVQILSAYQSGTGSSEYLFTTSQSALTGWTLVNGIARKDLTTLSSYVAELILYTAVIAFLAAAVATVLLGRTVSKPLLRLQQAISGMTNGRQITETFTDDEVSHVGQVLKETVARNIELQEKLVETDLKERDAELMLLHAQINPHFLYNTLDSIYCMAIVDGDEKIAEMVSALSDLFKRSLGKGNRIATLGEELDYIRVYMNLLGMRFGDRVTLKTDVEEGMLSLRVIRFLLQPFVENAVYHGIEPSMTPGLVMITGRRKGDDLYLCVEDNGVGMKSKFELDSGYGVKNVLDRIHLFYGPEYGIRITSRRGEGTRVEIYIPVMKEEKPC